jgi:PAS domain S-box-containing protein
MILKNVSIFATLALGAAAAVVALLIVLLFRSLLGTHVLYVFLGAVAISSAYGGFYTGLITTVLSAMLISYYVLPPLYTLEVDIAVTPAFVGFLIVSALVSRVYESRRRLVLDLESQRERLHVTLQGIGDGVIVTDIHGRVTMLNPVAEGLTGWKMLEATGRPLPEIFRIINDKTRQPVQNPIERVLSHGLIVGLANHTVLIARDGTERAIDDSGAPVRLSDGTLIGAVLVFRDISERYAQESALRESELRLRTVLENMPIILTANRGDPPVPVVWNNEFARVTGYTAKEMLGKPDATPMLYPDPDYYEQVLEGWRQKRGDYRNWEVWVTRKDGERRLVSWSNISKEYPIPGWDNWAVGIDVTEQHLAKERAALLQSITAALLDRLTAQEVADAVVSEVSKGLGTSLGTIYQITDDGESLELLSRYGLSDELYGQYRRLPLAISTPLGDVLRAGQPLWIRSQAEYEERYPAVSHAIRHNRTQSSAILPLQYDDRMIGGLTFSFQEPHRFGEDDQALFITIARQCAQALERARLYDAEYQMRQNAEQARERLTFLASASIVLSQSLEMQSTLDAIVQIAVPRIGDMCFIHVVDNDHTIRLAAVCHIDPSKEAALVENYRLYPPQLDAGDGVGWVVRTGQSELVTEIPANAITNFAIDTHQRELLAGLDLVSYLTVPLTARGRAVGALTFATSESGRRYSNADLLLAEELGRRAGLAIENARLYSLEHQARQQAEKANELKLQFLGMVSHELRTPLASIKGFASTLLATDVQFSPEQQIKFISIIDAEADRLRGLVDQLLDLSSLQAGTLQIFPEPQTIGALLDFARAQLVMLTIAHKFELDVPNMGLRVLADGQRIAQVLVNLVGNASKYAPRGTTIELRAVQDEEMVLISVTDQGPGIPPSERMQVFQLFHRSPDAKMQKGVGIGLAICKGLVEAHGGRIWIDDNPAGQGTRVSFTLPQGA